MMKTKNLPRVTPLLSLLTLLTLPTPMSAQTKLFTLEDLNFGGNNYRNMVPQNMWLTWWGEQLIQTDVEACYKIDARTGKKAQLFTLDQINQWGGNKDSNKIRHLMQATFPYPDKPIVAVDNYKVSLLIDFQSGQVIWQDSISGHQARDWNATSKATAYVEEHQLCVTDGQGNKHQLTTDGSREIVYGQSVHRNEFGIDGGTFWSPDGQHLAFYRMDQSMVTDYPQVDIYPRNAAYEPDKYPMAGMTSHKVTVGVYHLSSQKTVYLNAGDPTDRYFTNIAWSHDNKTIYMFELNRAQNDCRLVSYDAETGERLAELYRETSEKYVEPLHPIMFLPWDNTKFLMQSQKDGFNHLYLYNKEGKELKQLTAGNWVVQNVLGFNEKQKTVIIESNGRSALQRNLYAVNVNTGRRTALDNGLGIHRGSLSAKGTMLYDKYQEPTVPRIINLLSTANGKGTQLLKAEDPWKDYQQPIFENGSLKAAEIKFAVNVYHRP